MVGAGIFLCRGKAFAFSCDNMQELWSFQGTQIAQGGDQSIQIMAINGTDIVKSQFFEKGAWRNHAFHMFLGTTCQFPYWWHHTQDFLTSLPHTGVQFAGQHLGKIIRHAAHIGRNRHVIVVEDDQKIGVQITGMIQGLECHPCGKCPISDNGNHSPIALLLLCRNSHPKGRADGGT